MLPNAAFCCLPLFFRFLLQQPDHGTKHAPTQTLSCREAGAGGGVLLELRVFDMIAHANPWLALLKENLPDRFAVNLINDTLFFEIRHFFFRGVNWSYHGALAQVSYIRSLLSLLPLPQLIYLSNMNVTTCAERPGISSHILPCIQHYMYNHAHCCCRARRRCFQGSAPACC